MEWQDWTSVTFSERNLLPTTSGIYVVVDSENFVWYVGKAKNLKNRWLGRAHHRYPQLIRSSKKLQHRICWKIVPITELDKQEQLYIDKFKPELNGLRVKTYLPKEPQIDREIKRLIKALNKNTLLFPNIRSLVAGEYIDALEMRCIVMIVNVNDCIMLEKSARKRYSQKVRNAWIEIETFCGLDPKKHRPLSVNSYSLKSCRLEFIVVPEIIQYFEGSLQEQEKYLRSVEILGVAAKALNSLDFLEAISTSDVYGFIYSDGRKHIKDIAYLKHIKNDLDFLSLQEIC
ncbi:GIY-YIG nuclease family protein [Nodosilinea sp. PGN35]|uniref:GIY-YIG nuclease family protein n=1 Tax=Nodosilinea sp. PGN35 TaxID=3020489 RepID=UPI0023B2BD3D|nr:hypothetical protein [Nodosilinea sp. TSF1-S3]MDF0364778.1 hypothetical protein [Nodosilinea sp. TSF1-S3]